MSTSNIISTPNITGNIGSCSSQTISMDTSRSFFTASYKQLITNSCTGQVTEGPITWNLAWDTSLILIIIILIAFVGINAGMENY